jgi:hypothetical protein
MLFGSTGVSIDRDKQRNERSLFSWDQPVSIAGELRCLSTHAPDNGNRSSFRNVVSKALKSSFYNSCEWGEA